MGLPGRSGRGLPRRPTLLGLHATSGFYEKNEVAKVLGSSLPAYAFGSDEPGASRFFRVLHAVQRDPNCLALLWFCSPSGLFSQRSCPSPLGASTSLGPSLPFGVLVPMESTSPGFPRFRVTFRVQGFSPSSRFSPPPASRVYFTPQTPFGFTLQGFPLPRSHANSSPASCRLAVIPRLRSRHLE